jgi:hypothetical protein
MKYVLTLFAVIAFVAGAYTFDQGEEPSEKVFKNIVSFKGVPAKDLMPAMRFMNASMKVGCDYCHDSSDYSKDVPNKEITRKMIDLQRDINDKFFNGKLEVTCNTCHNGLHHPVAVPIVPTLANQHARYRGDQTPAGLFKKHLDAVGGAGPILRFKGTLKEGAAPEAPFEVVQSPDGRFLADLDGLKMGFDGTTAWTFDGTNVVKLWGDDAFSLARMGITYRQAAAFERYPAASIAGVETLGSIRALVVRGPIAAQNVTEELYFDQESGLLSRVAVFTRTTIGTVPSYVDYADYREVAGIKAAFKITSLSMDGKTTVAQYQSGEAAAGFDEKAFSPPAN